MLWAIAEIAKGAVEELKQDVTARTNEVKECVNDIEKNVAFGHIFIFMYSTIL